MKMTHTNQNLGKLKISRAFGPCVLQKTARFGAPKKPSFQLLYFWPIAWILEGCKGWEGKKRGEMMMYFLLNIGIFQCHVSNQGCFFVWDFGLDFGSFKPKSLYETTPNFMHYGKSPKLYHTFAFFNPPQNGYFIDSMSKNLRYDYLTRQICFAKFFVCHLLLLQLTCSYSRSLIQYAPEYQDMI